MMKKLLAYILAISLVLVPFPVSAFLNPEPQPVVYRGTITGLRISVVDGTAFIDNLSGATLDLGSSVVNATGTAAIRISSVDGTAFVDTADATLAAALAANAGKYLIITDASGRYLKGWIKAAGTGETLDSELVTNGNFAAWSGDNPTSWTLSGTETGTAYVTESAGKCRIVTDSAIMGINQVVMVAGALHKLTLAVDIVTSGYIYRMLYYSCLAGDI
jgi:hypothetical protein